MTTLDLGSVTYSYVHSLTRPSCHPMSCLPLHILLSCLRRGSSAHPVIICTCTSIPRKICPLPPLHQHHQNTTLPPLPYPHQACQISVAATPTLLPKYMLSWPSAAVPHPFYSVLFGEISVSAEIYKLLVYVIHFLSCSTKNGQKKR